jgi:hypothetical protein
LVREVVAVVAQVVAVLVEVVEGRARLAHKLLPLVRLPVAVVLAPRRVPLLPQPEAEVAALLLVQGLVASESLGSR